MTKAMANESKDYSRNKVKIQRGSINGKQLRFLGHVQECYGEDCKSFSICSFRTKREGSKCAVMESALKSIYEGFTDPLDGLGDVLTQLQLDRVGMHLVPLYQQLIKFSLETFTLRDPSYFDKQGKKHMHPEYKEIREVQACISKEIKDIGLNEAWNKKFGNKKGMPGISDQELEDVLIRGKRGAYERLLTED